MRIADFVAATAIHLADNEHHDGHDQCITDEHDDVECGARQTEVIGSHHVPHENRPDEHVGCHPREQQAPVGQC